jgi:N-acylneuraminate cytidylyltransferase
MNIAIIPARGGSKRMPRKNIKEFCGKPMIAWSIEAAKESGLFDRIIVSTDDIETAEVAIQWGAEVPFMRPAILADDFVLPAPVIAHATQWALDQGLDVAAVCCIFATAPFIRVADLKDGWSELYSGDWEYVFTATDFAAPIFRSFKQTHEGGVEMFFPEHVLTRSQDLPVALHDAGQFYWGRTSAWLQEKHVLDRYSKPLVIPRWRVQDIDTQDDWVRAEMFASILLPAANSSICVGKNSRDNHKNTGGSL